MGYTYYSRMIMIPASVEVNFDAIHTEIEKVFSGSNARLVTRPYPNKIEISFDEWTYHITWGVPYAEDIQTIAEFAAKERPDKEIIASSTITINIWGDQDPNMNHFDTYLMVLEVLEEIPNVYHYDNYDGKLWKSGEDPYKSEDSGKPKA